jgi:hypothetical protein
LYILALLAYLIDEIDDRDEAWYWFVLVSSIENENQQQVIAIQWCFTDFLLDNIHMCNTHSFP